MTALKRYLVIPILLACFAALAGDPRDDNPNPEPGPTLAKERIATITHEAPTNAAPQQLESVKAAKPAAPPVGLEKRDVEPKAVAMIMRNIYAVRTPQGVVLVDRDSPYLRDLTNIYPHQLIQKLTLTEP